MSLLAITSCALSCACIASLGHLFLVSCLFLACLSGLYFFAYQWLKPPVRDLFERHSCHPNSVALQHLVAGAGAGLFSVLCTQPQDFIKTRVQLRLRSRDFSPSASSHHWRAAEESLTVFFRGMFIRICRRVGTAAVTWTLYEYFVQQR